MKFVCIVPEIIDNCPVNPNVLGPERSYQPSYLISHLAVSLDAEVRFVPEVGEMPVACQEQIGRDQHPDMHVYR